MLTTGEKKFGLAGKRSGTERHTLSGWLEAEAARPDKEYGLIVRTNAAQEMCIRDRCNRHRNWR